MLGDTENGRENNLSESTRSSFFYSTVKPLVFGRIRIPDSRHCRCPLLSGLTLSPTPLVSCPPDSASIRPQMSAPHLSAVFVSRDGSVADLTQPELWPAHHLAEALARHGYGSERGDYDKPCLLARFRSTLQVFPQRCWRPNRTGVVLRRVQARLTREKGVRSVEAPPGEKQRFQLKRKAGEEAEKAKSGGLDAIVIEEVKSRVHADAEKTLTVVRPKEAKSVPRRPKIRRTTLAAPTDQPS